MSINLAVHAKCKIEMLYILQQFLMLYFINLMLRLNVKGVFLCNMLPTGLPCNMLFSYLVL